MLPYSLLHENQAKSLPRRLWSGSFRSVQMDHLKRLRAQGLQCIVSILPIGSIGVWSPDQIDPDCYPRIHKVLCCWDDDKLDPMRILSAIDFPGPTLIHCNAGKNRSTALAACWLLFHTDFHEKGPEAALEHVQSLRRTEVTRAMRDNVFRFYDNLNAESGGEP